MMLMRTLLLAIGVLGLVLLAGCEKDIKEVRTSPALAR
jgi:hypothetical protein